MVKNYHAGDLLSPSLESLCNKKLDKLDKYAKDLECDVYMSLEGKEHKTKMVLKSKNFEVVAQAKSDDMYKNIDVCIDALKAKMVKEKPTKKHSKHVGYHMPSEE
ncbi:MAG: ribosome-associated translation inhibitor RaiA [Clostridiales bacterium]|nr:ribosome-associated translation inhibitor RaiA [Candidatus Apopatousia equi]